MELELDFSDHEELEFANRSELNELAAHIEQVIARLAHSFSVGNAIKNEYSGSDYRRNERWKIHFIECIAK